MLTADQITALGDKAQRITDPIVEFLIQDIARRVRQAGQLTSTASYQIWRLQNLGMSQRQVQEEIRKRLKVSQEQVEELLTQSAEVGYNFDLKNLPHADAVLFRENATIQQIVSSGVQMAQEDLSNMVGTLGFVNHDGVSRPLTEAYQQACDFAFQKVAMGAQDYNSAIRQATKGLAERGIVSIDYESGVSTSIEAAVRRNLMSALGTMQEQISQQNHDDLGCDGWEISAHGASAPDHEPIQGKQYTDAKYNALNRSLIRRIGTLNCGHAAFPIILGVNEPQYSAAELEQFRQANEKGVDYEGIHYTMYEANLAAGGVFASSKAEEIVIHEYGHVIAAAKGNKGIEIVQKACYNVFTQNPEMKDILKLLRREISPYSATYYAKGKETLFFDPKRYKEIIPEVLAKNNSSPSDFTTEFIRILREML